MKRRKLILFGGCIAMLCVSCCVPVVALALAESRGYEMVSPVYKGGFGALFIEAASPDGQAVIYYSPGAFAGAPSGPEVVDYVARRGSTEWTTTPTMVPASLLPFVTDRDISASLSETLAFGGPGDSKEAAGQLGLEAGFLLHPLDLPDSTVTWNLVGEMLKPVVEEPILLKYEGASPDFCHILFGNAQVRKSAVLPEASKALAQVYELDRGCDGEPGGLRLVAVKNKLGPNSEPAPIDPECKVDIGMQDYNTSHQTTFNAVADDGHEIFFTTCVDAGLQRHQLFARLDGSRTIEVSKPTSETCTEVPCAGAATHSSADFIGASEDGSAVFFTTAQPLAPGDTGTANDLYMARIGCPESNAECEVGEMTVTSLSQISHDPNGGEAGFQGVVRLAPDGARAYFVATRNLLSQASQETLEQEGHVVPQMGADNVYVYDTRTGTMTFIADLCSGPQESGSVEDARCPSATGVDTSLWNTFGGGEEQTAGTDARILVFSSYGQLTPDDTDVAKDVYRFDATSATLKRVSLGESGSDANGNNNSFGATIPLGNWGGIRVQTQYEMSNRTLSEDGSTVVFRSTEALSPAATNRLSNMYVWHEGPNGGGVSLISGGSADEPVIDAVISAEGNDVFFVTVDGLVPQDTDGAPDIYDARVGGGFPESPAPREPCSSDACQGPLTNPAPLLVPGSVVQGPGENFGPKGKASQPKKVMHKPKKKNVKRRHAKRKAHTGRHRKAGRNKRERR